MRAREAAIGMDPFAQDQWRRLGEIWEAMGEMEQAEEAWARARALMGSPNSREGGAQ